MDAKITLALAPYDPLPVPYEAGDLPMYLDQEFQRLSEPLGYLTATWAPVIAVRMSEPTAPGSVSNLAPAYIQDYQDAATTQYANLLNLTTNPANGTINLNGDAANTYIVTVSAFVLMTRGTIPQNQEIFLYMTDGTTDYLLGADYIVENQQSYLSLGSTQTLKLPGNGALRLFLQTSTSAGNTQMQSVSFDIKIIESASSP